MNAPVPAWQVVRLSDVEPTRVEWLWSGRLPLAKLVICDGLPGLGKSTMLTDLAARITSGRSMPFDDAPARPRGVVILSAEDGYSDTIRPRFDAAQGDATRLVILDQVLASDGEHYRPPVIPDDIPTLEEIIEQEDAVLVVIDPMMAFLSSDTDSYRDQDVRRALHRVKMLAENTGACVVCVRHPTKGGAAGALAQYAGGGSVGIIGAARVGLYVGTDPKDADKRVLAVSKSNIARIPPSLVYSLEAADPLGVAHIAWHAESALTADELHAPRMQTRRDSLEARALDYLHTIAPRAASLAEVARELDEADTKSRTLRRALADLVDNGDAERVDTGYRVAPRNGGTPGVASATYLPTEAKVAPDTPSVPPEVVPPLLDTNRSAE